MAHLKEEKPLETQLEDASRFFLDDKISFNKLTCLTYDVPAKLQDGPQCGIVSTWMAANSLINVCEGGSGGGGGIKSVEQVQRLAKELGYTIQGEMFSADNLADLINKSYGATGQVTAEVGKDPKDFFLPYERLVEFFTDPDCHQLLLVPYDSDRDQRPCRGRGHKAHWAVVTGLAAFVPPGKLMSFVGQSDKHIVNNGNLCVINRCAMETETFSKDSLALRELLLRSEGGGFQLICRQSKSKRLFFFDPIDLIESNSNLEELGNLGRRYILPPGGVKEGLCRKCVIIRKLIQKSTF